jgi:hypothetical protein
MNRTSTVLTDTVPIQTIRARRPHSRTTGPGWHRGATQPIPVVVPREHWIARVRRSAHAIAEALFAGIGHESPAQQRVLEHVAMQRLLGR